VIGSASDMVGVWIEPVTAQLMIILFAIGSFLPVGRHSMIPKKPAPDAIRGGNRFSEKIMLDKKLTNVFFAERLAARRYGRQIAL
jgi:hypothetical protein